MNSQQSPNLQSDALKANLQETAISVDIPSHFSKLQEVVARYQGLSAKLEHLLYEISHPYRNWLIIIPELRAFVLKNLNHYRRHSQGAACFTLFTSIFLEALADSQKNGKLVSMIMEAMLAYADKLISSLNATTLPVFENDLNMFFDRLHQLDQLDTEVMMYMVQGHHPMKKMAITLISFGKNDPAIPFSYHQIARLMKKILTLNYTYWLEEEDPLPWFKNECGAYCQHVTVHQSICSLDITPICNRLPVPLIRSSRPTSYSPPMRGDLIGRSRGAGERLRQHWKAGAKLAAISHKTIQQHLDTLCSINIDAAPLDALDQLLDLPAHMDMVRLYRQIPAELARESADDDDATCIENRKLLFLFRIMETKGLHLIHEETLREINRSLVQLIRKQSFEEIEEFFGTTIQLLKENVRKYPHTSLQCIQVIGGEVFKRNNSRLVEAFLWKAVRFGFQYANVMGVDEDWQPITNPSHLANIRVWLNLIMQEPKWCSTLFSALIINIKLSGTCVKDTDLFQRDITDLLNHPIGPIYNLAKQFTKLMPVFFNEIGAEGELREVSTELDESHKRRDVLIHFLRKQSHVESSNLIVDFIEAIFTFWITLDKKYLRPFLPDEILDQVERRGIFVDEQHILTNRIRTELQFDTMADILSWNENDRSSYLEKQQDISALERRRFELLVKMFLLLHHKYNLGMQELRNQLELAAAGSFPEMQELLDTLDGCETFRCLSKVLTHLEQLKTIILSDEKFEPKEEIYYKRHIAVDIPSVYGRYSERKFDALGLTFRLENLANIYLERLTQSINLRFITQATFLRISKCIRMFIRALRIDGISSRRLETYASLLSSSIAIKRFSYTQYLDIMRGLSEGVKDIIYAYYNNVHQNNLSIIIPQIGKDNLLTKYRSLWDEDDLPSTMHRLSESFFRDLIATTFGLQHLDNFVTNIIQTLEAQKDIADANIIDLLMTYNPEKTISSLHNQNRHTHNLIHLGNKGFNLMMLAGDGHPVPPAFIITTEIFRCWQAVQRFSQAREEFVQRMHNSISSLEQETGHFFGSSIMPLLLSVRSGSAMSMPGMMTTIHNVGLNEQIVEEYVADHPKQEYFLWDNYRRFLQSWAMAGEMGREEFQTLMNQHKKKYNVSLKRQFKPREMHELALKYKQATLSRNCCPPDAPWDQLMGAIELVQDSWNTPKAREYRHLLDVSDDWGTAVIIQAMVYGNRSEKAGSGVLFTAHPYRKVRQVALWGDYASKDQGEDIVSGLVTSYPISIEQGELDGRPTDNSLEQRFPKIYKRLLEISRDLVYDKEWNPQEIEFTFEGSEPEDLFILQTRDMITIKKKERFDVFAQSEHLNDCILGRGIGVSGSAMSGIAVFTEENIHEMRRKDSEAFLILIRQDTVPEDIKEISMADGLLTARGGQTSHASVVATRLEKTCVVGCRDLRVVEAKEYARINNVQINFGDPVSIDGRNGLFLRGTHEIREEVHILPL